MRKNFRSSDFTGPIRRRSFLKRAAGINIAAATFPTIIPASALGRDGAVAPSNRISVACIGVGPQGTGDMRGFLAQKDAQVLAVCDVKAEQREQARALINQQYQNQDCKVYLDFREVLGRRDIDACLVATPDHWHVPVGLTAVRAGKDVYIEKPIGCSVGEAQALRKAVHTTGRVFQFGTQQRSDRKFRTACELARNGLLGKLRTIHVWAPGSAPGGSTKAVSPPATIDYDRWLGPAPFKPYTEHRCDSDGITKTWWFESDYALGFIAGWGIHPMDIAIWGAGDLMKGVVELDGTANYPTEGACNTATIWDVRMKFDSGLDVVFAASPNGQNSSKPTGEVWPHETEWRGKFGQITTHGTVFEGTDGWVRVQRGEMVASRDELTRVADKDLRLRLPISGDHVANFLDAVKTRKPAIAPIDDAVWADTLCQISDIAARLRRKLRFDFRSERFIGDEEANNRLAMREMRAPWQIS